jgi:hypothetical protein
MSVSIQIARSRVSLHARGHLESACSGVVMAEQLDLFDSQAWAAMDHIEDDECDVVRACEEGCVVIS